MDTTAMNKTVSDEKWDEAHKAPLENKKLKDKVAVIYGAAGAVGSTAAQAFAREGASVFLTGRSTSKLNKVAQEISSDNLSPEVAEVDALDEQGVNHHLEKTFEKTGRIDISFNATGIPLHGVEGTPLVKLSTESFLLPISTYTKSQFITAKAAARFMIRRKSGVILFHTPNPARLAAPLMGGMAPAWASMEALSRNLSLELASSGIRTVCVRTTGLPETETITVSFGLHAQPSGMTREQFQGFMEGMTHTKRLTTLGALANGLVFASSDQSSGMTGAVLNLTGGMISD
jgi:NAD(P)-dependent dehydrogenase (short-subunit alcohol dehydrogenase family)